MAGLRVRRIGYALGAEVRGIDLRRPMDDETYAQVRAAWLEHVLLCFPDQILSRDELVAFASRFGGELDDNGKSKGRDPENAHVLLLSNKPVAGRPWDGYKQGENWHSDRSVMDRPATGTFVLAKEIPDVGGDTMFSNQYMAYDALSPKLQSIVEGLSAVHDATLTKNFERQGAELAASLSKDRPPVVHPAVKVHPETGRKALFIGDRVRKFVGMTEEESRPLLDFLIERAVAYELSYRHRWSVNDLVMWDNRASMHIALPDYDQSRQARHMWRCSLWGPRTGIPYDPSAESMRLDREPIKV